MQSAPLQKNISTATNNSTLSNSSKGGISLPAVPIFQQKPVQKKELEEDPMQAKLATQLKADITAAPPTENNENNNDGTAQLKDLEDELPMQGKFIAQRMELEEEQPIQGKFIIQRKEREEQVPIQPKFKLPSSAPTEQKPFQRFALPKSNEPETVQTPIQKFVLPTQPIQKKANNTGLPDNLKAGVENLSGFSMDDVKVHYNSAKPAQLQAHAYAQGTDIHIGPGQEKHLPHEAWHVVQQKQGRVQATMQMKGGVGVNDDKGLENEADVMGGVAVFQKKVFLEKTIITNQNVVQRTKVNELTEDICLYYISLQFIAILTRNELLNELPKIRVDLKKIIHHKEYDIPETWITLLYKFVEEQKKSDANRESSQTSMSSSTKFKDMVLPKTMTYEGTHVSFSTNVQSGVNGFFDLWYYHSLNTLDVDVKFNLPKGEETTLEEFNTLKSIQQFWTNKFKFKDKNDTIVSVNINIIKMNQDEVPHFDFVTTNDTNPNVLRSNKQFTTRTIEQDKGKGRQISAHHEFGHVLGLSEEYDLNSSKEDKLNYQKMMKVATGHDNLSTDDNVSSSIMGLENNIQPQHYGGILIAFNNLIDPKNEKSLNWTIVPV